MITVHVETKIDDYDVWRNAFDRYDRARREHHVLAYRISRPTDDPGVVFVDLDFENRADATGFTQLLEKIWQTPLSQSVSPGHSAPELRELLEQGAQG
jgi:hypothetical protein